MVSIVEPWWAGLCAPPFDYAQGDNVLEAKTNCHPRLCRAADGVLIKLN
ncbi:hypothetical protein [Mucilaginibacter myungsuensis]|uniref:Uncharacterized protein n=1 Tax=Mucilaginibacter myungsuensis TaxID=649104 RepID=A0A929KW71_9SPHI|nr:hypothetical protein [Mucilaginibacter myungsuensis]MBE9661832.1 hypothetical protein [Mucilaginibacter myungsuensis]MDN3599734.1 hypothetical protein [Mucilaginibacter myungsuensis]